jgi:hypothetical protein
MKQSSIEWLMEIDKSRAITIEEWQQAKEMEKERMFEVYHGYQDYLDNEFKNQLGGQSVILTFEQYYNETFNTNG